MSASTSTTAKVYLSQKTPYNTVVDGEEVLDQVALYFYADYADERNKEWAKYTPAISVTMTVLPEVADKFPTNGKFTLTFTPEETAL